MAHAKATLENWRTAPFNHWALHHVREIVPSAEIAHDPRRVRELPAAPADFSGLGIESFLEATDSDGMAIVHHGRLVFERYGNGMAPSAQHIAFSVSKSLLGLLADEMRLDPRLSIIEVLPELRGTAYEGATVRHLLDMRAGVAFEEDYLATSGTIIDYRKATGWNPLGPGEAPSDLHSFYRLLVERDGPHGGRFHYLSPNTDLLGWVIERVSGRRYAELMSELLWTKIGAERDAYITVDRLGAPRAAGGMCVTLRDLARVGLWMLEAKGAFLDDVEANGDPAAWAAGDLVQYYPGLPMRYRAQWYLVDGKAPLAFAMGIHGQNLFVDRANGIVIAKLSSQAVPLDASRMAETMRFVEKVRQHLARR